MKRAAAGGHGGAYQTSGGPVRVFSSPAFTYDASVNQSFADFFASLYHGSELQRLTVYIAPFSEMQAACGSKDADSCFDPNNDMIVLVGSTPPDGTSIEEIAAHEYGHVVANHRSNRPWPAEDWGPKYWASSQGICPGVASGLLFPGAEGTRYADNPGEIWAETNRVLNGGSQAWNIVDPAFFPSSDALTAAKYDITQPWPGNHAFSRRGSFARSSHARTWSRTFPTPLDGALRLTLHGHGPLDADLYAYDHKTHHHLLGRSTRNGSNESVTTVICGPAAIDVVVRRYSGSGSWRLDGSLP